MSPLSQELTEIPEAAEGDTEATPPDETSRPDQEADASSSQETASEDPPEDPPEDPLIDTNNSKTTAAEASPPEARLVVIGNATFANNRYFERQLNGDVFLNAVSWLGRQDQATLSIRPKEATNRRIVMTLQQQLAVGASALLILPLSGFIGAIVIWLKRR